jgi:hypothetical protein
MKARNAPLPNGEIVAGDRIPQITTTAFGGIFFQQDPNPQTLHTPHTPDTVIF